MTSARVRSALACLLFLAQVLAPLMHWRANAAPLGWIEVCASDGLRRTPVGDGSTPHGHHEDHCPLCRASGSMPGLAAALPRPVATQAEEEAPALPIVRFFSRLFTHDAQARAPPSGC